ncbi:17292_t:CDS:1 [Funneliformis geosporum]|uniref:8263_t:CDS:1 n=1 Tax=Funneliformis geosporum TaxID=1117311 RepID=A0A9W4STV6_9GLOM|nr:17292_t:CDS:1 [Funneliformis geosporum]CAI2181268.1 8263_t:CDS:1 [Funneliformis geosporum]
MYVYERFWVNQVILILVLLVTLTVGQIPNVTIDENTTGLGALYADSSHPDNTIVFRLARYEAVTGCNEAIIMFRTITAEGIVTPFNLAGEDIADISPTNFCRSPNDVTPKGTPDDSPKGTPDDSPDDSPKGTAKSPAPVPDRIGVLTFADNLILLYFQCGTDVLLTCGNIYLKYDIRTPLQKIRFEEHCTEYNAIRGQNGFLFLCYTGSTLSWQNWVINESLIKRINYGEITEVNESLKGSLVKVFPVGPGSYSVVIGSYKQYTAKNLYIPPIGLAAYFLTSESEFYNGPFNIYYNLGQGETDEVKFAIQVCHAQVGGYGYRCLITIKRDPITKFISIGFSEAGKITSTYEFQSNEVTPTTDIGGTVSLRYGGYCIIVVDNGKFDGIVFNEKGVSGGKWGMPEDINYSTNVGVTYNNTVYGMEQITNATSWRVYFSQQLQNYKSNL